MTQVNATFKLPSVREIPGFNFQENQLLRTQIHIPSFPQPNIPSFHFENKRFDSVDLGNSVVKKVKPNPDVFSMRIPSFQPNNFGPSNQDPFLLSQSARALISDLCESPKLKTGKSRAHQRVPEQKDANLLEKRFSTESDTTSQLEGSDNDGISCFSSQSLAEKAAKKKKTRVFEKKELSSNDEKSFKQKYGFDLKKDTSLDQSSFGGLYIPKFVDNEVEKPRIQPQGQLQNALQDLRQKLLFPSKSEAQTPFSELSQGILSKNARFPLKNLFNAFADNFINEKAKSTMLDPSIFATSDNKTQSTNSGSNKSCSATEISEDELSLDNLDQIYNSEPQAKKEEFTNGALKYAKDTFINLSEPSIDVSNRKNSSISASTAASNKTEEKEPKKEAILPTVPEVKRAKEVKKISLRPTKSSEKSKKQVETAKSIKVTKKEFQKEVVKKVKVSKIRTRSTPILISRWELASQRRKNRWQLTKRTNRTIQKGSKKINKVSPKADTLIHVRPEDAHETPVGQKYQAPVVPPMPSREPNPRRGLPKLMWNPKNIRKGILDFYFRKLCEILKYDEINEEKAIKLLREEGNDVKKVLERIQGKEKDYAKEFALKLRKKL